MAGIGKNRCDSHSVAETPAGQGARSSLAVSKDVGNVTASRQTAGLALVVLAAAVLGGCAETMPFTQLPDVTKLPEKLLSKDEQQGKVNEMIAKGERHQTEAAKEIEKGK